MSIDQDRGHTGEAHAIARFSGRLQAALDRLVDAPAWSMTAEEQRRSLVDLDPRGVGGGERQPGPDGGRRPRGQGPPDRVTTADRRRAEAHLLAEAEHHDARDLKLLGRRILEVLDPDAADQEEGRKLAAEEAAAARATFLRLRDNGDGTHSGAFKISDLHAHMLKKMLSAFVSPRRIGPEARRRADGTPVPGPSCSVARSVS